MSKNNKINFKMFIKIEKLDTTKNYLPFQKFLLKNIITYFN